MSLAVWSMAMLPPWHGRKACLAVLCCAANDEVTSGLLDQRLKLESAGARLWPGIRRDRCPGGLWSNIGAKGAGFDVW